VLDSLDKAAQRDDDRDNDRKPGRSITRGELLRHAFLQVRRGAPQVEVTAMYPGASVEVLEATVAQPLESKIIGVDKMIYIKSTSGNDGTYTLTAMSTIASRSNSKESRSRRNRHRYCSCTCPRLENRPMQ